MEKIAFMAYIKISEIDNWLALDWINHGMNVKGEDKYIVTGRVDANRYPEVQSCPYVIICDMGRPVFPMK